MTGQYRFSEERLEDVVELFTSHRETREAIAQRLGVNPRTVERYLAEARRRGMLPHSDMSRRRTAGQR